MNKLLSKYLGKLYLKQWTIGICRGDIKDVIRNRNFNLHIKWLPLKSTDQFLADPFLSKTKEGNYAIFVEDYRFSEQEGKISVIIFDKNLKEINHKIVLDTKSHLSYPFIFSEDDKVYVFPEASRSDTLSCYQYDSSNNSLIFVQEVMNISLLDSTILKYNEKYWLFATLKGTENNNKLYIFFADKLLGPYTPHQRNPVKKGLDGTRPAGNFIEVDGSIYRPSQNSKNRYGESITINKIIALSENDFCEESHMVISLDKETNYNCGPHTINVIDDIIVIDGQRWMFSPVNQLINLARKSYKSNKEKSETRPPVPSIL